MTAAFAFCSYVVRTLFVKRSELYSLLTNVDQ
jgi:hypothetical protein